jgi:plasmid stabilization system protein ParE
MRVEYTNRVLADLRKISADSRAFGNLVTAALEARIRKVVARIAEHPETRHLSLNAPACAVVPLIRYPYKIFFRVLEGRVRILHIRHTARRPWTERQ